MKWSININQRAALEMKLEVDMVDLAIFDMLKDYTPTPACKKMQENGQQYFSVPYKKVLEELPLLPLKNGDSVYRRFKKLESAGLIQTHPDNAKLSMVWFMWGRNYAGMVSYKTPGFKSEGMPETPGFISAPPRIENRTPPDVAPTHNNTFPITSSFIRECNAALPLQPPFEKVGEIECDGTDSVEAEKEKIHPPVAAHPPKKEKAVLVVAIPENLNTPEFTEVWDELLKTPKWKKKTSTAVERTLKSLSKYEVTFSIAQVECAISNGWQGVVFPDTPEKYEKWKKFNGYSAPAANSTPGRSSISWAGADFSEYEKPQAF